MRRRIESELGNLQTANIIKKVTHAEWAAPVVPIIKKSGSIQLCSDYKLTADKAVMLDRYPLLLAEEFARNSQVANASQSSTVNLFQRTMDHLLKGLSGVTIFLDDILVTGKTSEEHVQNLQAVCQRLSDSGGLKLR